MTTYMLFFIHYPKPMHGIVDLHHSSLKFDEDSEMFITGLHGHSAGFLISCFFQAFVHTSQETRLPGIYVTMLIA